MGSEASSRLVVRLAIGLVQGFALALLFLAYRREIFPATVPGLLAPSIVVALFIPLLVSQALGNLRRPTLIAWSIAAAVIVAGLAWYDVWHSGPSVQPFALPVSLRALLTCAIFLFVAHALVSCGDADGRIVARYPTLFDLAWKLGVQIAIILCFVTAFWIMLRLGIALFDMIKLTGFGHLVQEPMFAVPLTTVAAAAALHATDTSAPLVRGVRTLTLTMLGWLLPVIALIALAFLVSLVVTGLQPLWATRTAALLLIATASVLVIHINAAYQDGDQHPSHILRVAGTLASVLLVFLVWIAAYALWLRVTQYGWTVDRITSAGAVAVAGMFAVGYLIAAVLPGPWLKFIEHWNVYGTFFFLIVLLALATPIADPMRLSVTDQVQRLKSGMVKPAVFDFTYLHWQGGRFGRDALADLRKSDNKVIRDLAANPSAAYEPRHHTAQEIAAAITVHPAGKALPPSFVAQKWVKTDPAASFGFDYCVDAHNLAVHCDAIETDLDGDGVGELILLTTVQYTRSTPMWSGAVFQLNGGAWHNIGQINANYCLKVRDDLLAGKFKLVPPTVPNIDVAGHKVAIEPIWAVDSDCDPDAGSIIVTGIAKP